MTKSFEIECDSPAATASAGRPEFCGKISIEVSVQCRDSDGADSEYTIESVTDLASGADIDWNALSPGEQLRINAGAEALAEDYACEAYQEYAEGAADQAYDQWRDEQMERGE